MFFEKGKNKGNEEEVIKKSFECSFNNFFTYIFNTVYKIFYNIIYKILTYIFKLNKLN
jgi:hypothetical protein